MMTGKSGNQTPKRRECLFQETENQTDEQSKQHVERPSTPTCMEVMEDYQLQHNKTLKEKREDKCRELRHIDAQKKKLVVITNETRGAKIGQYNNE